MADNIREKQKKVLEQGYRAAKSDRLYPRELQNVSGDRWEDAKIGTYGAKNTTRQQSNFSREHMTEYGQALSRRNKQTREADVMRGNRATAPTPPTAKKAPARTGTKTSQKEVNTRRQYEEAFGRKRK